MTPAAGAPQGRRFSVAQLALLAPWVALVIGAWSTITDNSFLWHIRSGTLQIEEGTVLTADPFSFTRGGEEWVTQSWLVELLFGWAESVDDLSFVPLSILVVGGLTFLGIGVISYRFSKSASATAFVLVLGVLTLITFFVPRPVIYSYLLMVLVMMAWDRSESRWAVPLLFWIWASVHGSFVIGLAYVGLALVMHREWREVPKAFVAGLVTLFTAHGLGAVTFLFDFAESRDALQYLTEWRRPGVDDLIFIPYLGTLLFCVVGFARRKVPLQFLWLFVPFAVLGFTSVRALPPAWLGLLPVVSLSFVGLEIGTRAGLRQRLAAIYASFVLLMPFLLAEGATISEERFPTRAVSALEQVNTFHDDRVGGYLIWAEWPEQLVYIDDRAELYSDRMGEFVRVRRGDPEWRAVFERDGIQQALLANTEPLIRDLIDAGWDRAYTDQYFTVLRPMG